MKITFNGLPNATLGVEFELQVRDPQTRNLVSGASRIIERTEDGAHIKPELIQSTIELNTDVCANVATVRIELSERIRQLLATRCKIASAGTHPLAEWSE